MKQYFGLFLLFIVALIFYSGVSYKGKWVVFRYILFLLPLVYTAPLCAPKGTFDFDFSWPKKEKIIDRSRDPAAHLMIFSFREKVVIAAISTSLFAALYRYREIILPFFQRNIFLLPLIFIAIFLLYENQKKKENTTLLPHLTYYLVFIE